MGKGGEIDIWLLHRGNLKHNANITECIKDKNKFMGERLIYLIHAEVHYDNTCKRILYSAVQM